MPSNPEFPYHFDDEVTTARKVAMNQAKNAVNFDSLADSLMGLENLAAPFFLGLDNDPDDSDLDVWP